MVTSWLCRQAPEVHVVLLDMLHHVRHQARPIRSHEEERQDTLLWHILARGRPELRVIANTLRGVRGGVLETDVPQGDAETLRQQLRAHQLLGEHATAHSCQDLAAKLVQQLRLNALQVQLLRQCLQALLPRRLVRQQPRPRVDERPPSPGGAHVPEVPTGPSPRGHEVLIEGLLLEVDQHGLPLAQLRVQWRRQTVDQRRLGPQALVVAEPPDREVQCRGVNWQVHCPAGWREDRDLFAQHLAIGAVHRAQLLNAAFALHFLGWFRGLPWASP
mmetsp:Transcript_122271/g.391167  ORF Transcript_122271/g.391167 Transcript_122271/m.391167 type:complete len:274 (+) Transcript_122271:577-1398(+)